MADADFGLADFFFQPPPPPKRQICHLSTQLLCAGTKPVLQLLCQERTQLS